MIRTTIIQEVGLEERLKPVVAKEEVHTTTYQCSKPSLGNGIMHSKLTCGLLRSPSLERLRQFPSYLCTKGSYDFKVWLENSRIALSNSIYRSLQVAHEILFSLFVYCIIVTVLIQVCLVMNALFFCNVPTGPTFLYVTTSVLGMILFVALPHTDCKSKIKQLPRLDSQREMVTSGRKTE